MTDFHFDYGHHVGVDAYIDHVADHGASHAGHSQTHHHATDHRTSHDDHCHTGHHVNGGHSCDCYSDGDVCPNHFCDSYMGMGVDATPPKQSQQQTDSNPSLIDSLFNWILLYPLVCLLLCISTALQFYLPGVCAVMLVNCVLGALSTPPLMPIMILVNMQTGIAFVASTCSSLMIRFAWHDDVPNGLFSFSPQDMLLGSLGVVGLPLFWSLFGLFPGMKPMVDATLITASLVGAIITPVVMVWKDCFAGLFSSAMPQISRIESQGSTALPASSLDRDKVSVCNGRNVPLDPKLESQMGMSR